MQSFVNILSFQKIIYKGFPSSAAEMLNNKVPRAFKKVQRSDSKQKRRWYKKLLGPANTTKISVNTSFLNWYLAHVLKLSEQMLVEKEIRII